MYKYALSSFVLKVLLYAFNVASIYIPFHRCTLLAGDHPCFNLQRRGTNSSLPQFRSIQANINIQIGISIVESTRDTLPDPCLDFVEYFFCILGAPPCDPDSGGLPMLVCDSDCEAFTILHRDGTCDSTIEFFHNFADNTGNDDLNVLIEHFDNFECKNVSTYYFSEPEFYSDQCTGLLSDESKGWVIKQHLFLCIFSLSSSLQCLSFSVTLCLSFDLSVCLSICLSSVCLSLSLSVCLFVCLSLSLSLSLSLCLSLAHTHSLSMYQWKC